MAAERYAFTAEAIESVRICRLPQRTLLGALRELGAAEQLWELIVGDLLRAQQRMLLLGRMSATERVAFFLISQSKRPQPRWVRRPRIWLPMSRRDIADHLGLNVETISGSLAQLAKSGVIAVPNIHEIAVVDPLRLEVLARGQPDRSMAPNAVRGELVVQRPALGATASRSLGEIRPSGPPAAPREHNGAPVGDQEPGRRNRPWSG